MLFWRWVFSLILCRNKAKKKKGVPSLTCQSLMKILRSQVQPHNAWMLFILNAANLARWGRVTRLGRFISILSKIFLWAVEVCQKIQCNWGEQVVLSRSTLAAFIHTLPLQGTKCMGRRLIRKTFQPIRSAPSVFLHPSIHVIIPVSWVVSTYWKYWQIGNDFCSFACVF